MSELPAGNSAAPELLDPLGDLAAGDSQSATKNFAKVGSARPSNLIYNYGPGSTIDLPAFTVMPAGLDDWERVWARRPRIPAIYAPKLLEAVATNIGPWVSELRPFPWAPARNPRDASDLGVPARVFPQWMRCTGCDYLGMLTNFEYRNTNPYRPDEAKFTHANCRGKDGGQRLKQAPAVPARYLLACIDGHVDEFPYSWWVHKGGGCIESELPRLAMQDRTVGKGASATILCRSCGARRGMNEALGENGATKLPRCRGRHPHLGRFDPVGCKNRNRTKLLLLGASNLWFPSTLAVVVMPQGVVETAETQAAQLRDAVSEDLADYVGALKFLRGRIKDKLPRIAALADVELQQVLDNALKPPLSEADILDRRRTFDPTSLLVPEWVYLQKDPQGRRHRADDESGLVLSPPIGGIAEELSNRRVHRVLAIDRLRKVNALIGFTRVDEMDRVNDIGQRLAPLSRARLGWTVATEDRGEGIFLQLEESAVEAWEQHVERSDLFAAHREAHTRNFLARFSETAADVDPDTRFAPARYWLLHTLAHVLIREMAMYAGYAAASLTERIYSWRGDDDLPAAAGLMIITTASDSDGTLGGLVQLSSATELERVFTGALSRARRCSSDPVCAQRVPKDPEDFLHGAACHTCAFASETSCERANRFLDRRFLVPLPGFEEYGFFR